MGHSYLNGCSQYLGLLRVPIQMSGVGGESAEKSTVRFLLAREEKKKFHSSRVEVHLQIKEERGVGFPTS